MAFLRLLGTILLKGLQITFVVTAALIALTYVVPLGAKLLFSGDGQYDVNFYGLPTFNDYELKFPPIDLDEEQQVTYSFRGFFTSNRYTFVSFCIESAKEVDLLDLSSKVRLNVFEDKSIPAIEEISGPLNSHYRRTLETNERTPVEYGEWSGQRISTPIEDSTMKNRLCYFGHNMDVRDISWFTKYRVSVEITDIDPRYQDIVGTIELRSGWK